MIFILILCAVVPQWVNATEGAVERRVHPALGTDLIWGGPVWSVGLSRGPYRIVGLGTGITLDATYFSGDEDFGGSGVRETQEVKLLMLSGTWLLASTDYWHRRGFHSAIGIGACLSHLDWSQTKGPRGTGPYQTSEWSGLSLGPVVSYTLAYRFQGGRLLTMEAPLIFLLRAGEGAPEATAILRFGIGVPF